MVVEKIIVRTKNNEYNFLKYVLIFKKKRKKYDIVLLAIVHKFLLELILTSY